MAFHIYDCGMDISPELTETDRAIVAYRNGYSLKEIFEHRERLLGRKVPQSTIGNWVRAAREVDFDLEIEHLLASRLKNPGIYSNWVKSGMVLVEPSYSKITNTLYLGHWDYFPFDHVDVSHLKIERSKRKPRKPLRPKSRGNALNEALSSIVVNLRDEHSWSFRRIAEYLKSHAPSLGVGTGDEDIDRIRTVSLATVHRIYQKYSAQAHRGAPRSGLVKEVAIQHGGEIKFEGNPDEHRQISEE